MSNKYLERHCKLKKTELVFYKFWLNSYKYEYRKQHKKIRELKNLKQEYVATQLGISQQQYSEIERNKVDIKESRLREIAQILEVKPEDILTFDDRQVFNIFENQNSTVNGTFIQNSDQNVTDKLIQQHKEYLNEIIKIKDEEIALLKSLIEAFSKKL